MAMSQNEAIEFVFNECRERIVPNPKTRYKTSTGNLAFNSLKIEKDFGVAHIYIDERIAPYMVYTNEKWISPKWHELKNPNEGWFGRMALYIAKRIAIKMNGELFDKELK